MQEHIQIKGHLGPLQAEDTPIELEISPLTVFIGPQGTGKSLVSQLLYFFRDAHYLISTHSKQNDPDESVRRVIDGIRSGESSKQAFASFVINNKVEIQHSAQNSDQRAVTCYQINRGIRPTGTFNQHIQNWLQQIADNPTVSGQIHSQALFVPAERSFFSRLINSDPQALGSPDLPITMREFTKVLFKAANIHQQWQEGQQEKPPEANDISEMLSHELRGHAVFSRSGPYARRWQWMPDQSPRPIEIEMASSGQMETWPMVSIAQALFDWAPTQRPIFLHIEEPETHLHPSAQVAMTKLIAYLCNKGFRLVITTHSLFVLYVLNNLVLANQYLPNQDFDALPNASIRLKPEQLSAYLFTDGTAVSIRDQESGQLDEQKLSSVLGDLEVQYNQIQAYDLLWS
ncbi:MAG: AAA family ATPase [Cyanobacteria bacterium P01_F01_bin.150]